MLQAQTTTRPSANRRLALVPTLTGIGYLALTAIVLAWGVSPTDELGRTVDYVRDGTFALTLLLTIAAAATLGPTLGISRRAFGLVALGELLVFVGVLVGLVTGASPSWFVAVGLPGNLLAFLGLALIGRHAWRTRAFPRWLAVLFFLAVPLGIGIAEYGGVLIPAALWLCVGQLLDTIPQDLQTKAITSRGGPDASKIVGFIRRISLGVAVVAVFALAGAAMSAPGDLDPTFDGDGRSVVAFDNPPGKVNAMALQSDGKIVLAGRGGSGAWDVALARLNADGSPDTGFGSNGRVVTDVGFLDIANGVAIQPDGKIVVAGVTGDGLTEDFLVARYNADGSLDPSFGGDGTVVTDLGALNDVAYAVAVAPSGRLVVAGSSEQDFALVSYGAGGTVVDRAVTDDPARFGEARALAIKPSGTILVAGWSSDGEDGDFVLATYDSGLGRLGFETVDLGTGSDIAHALGLQSNGKAVLAGESSGLALARLGSSGLDTTFGDNGKVRREDLPGISGVAVQSDDSIVAAAAIPSGQFVIARFRPNGAVDDTFGTAGTVVTSFGTDAEAARAVAIQSDGAIVAAGQAGNEMVAVRYLADAPAPPADTTAPSIVISAPADGSVYDLGASVVASYGCTDEAGGSGVASCVGTVANGSTIDTSSPAAHSFTVTAADAAGNTRTAAVGYTVRAAPPSTVTLTLPDDVTAEATGPNGAAVTYSVSASGGASVSCAPGSGATFALGATTVRCAATDAAGNRAEGAFVVRVVDTTPPVFLNEKQRVDVQVFEFLGALSGAFGSASYPMLARDLVDLAPTLACTPEPGSYLAVGETLVRCTATDDADNVKSIQYTIRLRGPSQALADLSSLTSTSAKGPALRTLTGLLADLTTSFAKSNLLLADAKLAAFVLEVQKQTNKGVSEAAARELVAMANALRFGLFENPLAKVRRMMDVLRGISAGLDQGGKAALARILLGLGGVATNLERGKYPAALVGLGGLSLEIARGNLLAALGSSGTFFVMDLQGLAKGISKQIR
jgi:uncharacterized delta-60 repeat protein